MAFACQRLKTQRLISIMYSSKVHDLFPFVQTLLGRRPRLGSQLVPALCFYRDTIDCVLYMSTPLFMRSYDLIIVYVCRQTPMTLLCRGLGIGVEAQKQYRLSNRSRGLEIVETQKQEKRFRNSRDLEIVVEAYTLEQRLRNRSRFLEIVEPYK